MLSVQGEETCKSSRLLLDYKCLLRISAHKITFIRFLWCFSFSLILTTDDYMAVMMPCKNVATSVYLILIGTMQATGQPSGLKNIFLLLCLINHPCAMELLLHFC